MLNDKCVMISKQLLATIAYRDIPYFKTDCITIGGVMFDVVIHDKRMSVG